MAWGWVDTVRRVLCGSHGFPQREEDIYPMPFLRILGQLKYLIELSDIEEAEMEAARKKAEAEAAASRAKTTKR